MFAFGFQASRFRERGAESFGLHGFTAYRVSEDGEQRASEGGAREQKRRAEETEGEVRAWRHAGIKHGKRKIS